MRGCFLACYNEANGVANSKNMILRRKSNKTISYFGMVLITFLLMCFLAVLCLYVDFYLAILVLFMSFLYLALTLFRFLGVLSFRQERDYKNTVKFDSKGISGEFFDGINITFSWERLKAVVIKKKTVVILTDMSIFFYFTIKEKEKILEAIDKYNKEMLVIGN